MSFIKNLIVGASNTTGCKVTHLEGEVSASLRRCIEEKYCSNNGQLPLWERLDECQSRFDPEGWKAIGEFPFEGKVTMFFDKENETSMFSINSCCEAVSILSECPGFVFYITSKDCSFLLCHNDHDYLIGAGTAKQWVGSDER